MKTDEARSFPDLVAMLVARAEDDERGYTFVVDGDERESHFSFRALDRDARAIGALLTRHNLANERVLLLYPTSAAFVGAFFGALYAKAIAVPAYPPDPARLERLLPRLRAIANDCGARAVLTTGAIKDQVQRVLSLAPELAAVEWIATDRDVEDAEHFVPPAVAPSDLAFLQYTSGSTGSPKGVMLSHGNVVRNLAMSRAALRAGDETVAVSWLPIFHDMGLILCTLFPVYVGGRAVLMAPELFLQKPVRWLRALSRHRGTMTAAPNFAYDLVTRKVTDEELASLDLSAARHLVNGAEPVRADVIARFEARLAAAGLQRDTVRPGYGLAEASVFVAYGDVTRPVTVLSLDPSHLEHGRARPAKGPDARTLVSCGNAWLDQTVTIVDPASSRRLGDGEVGEIWVRGSNVGAGYWTRPEASRETFGAELEPPEHGPHLRTGDLGFVHEGELFITGRIKDVIIVRGRNHYPHDIESTAQQACSALRRGCIAAVALDGGDGDEEVALVAEVDERQGGDVDALRATLTHALASQHDLALGALVLLKPGMLPKTSSGKIQRAACRKLVVGALRSASLESNPNAGAVVARWQRSRTVTAVPARRADALVSWLIAKIAEETRLAPSELDPTLPFATFGLGSKSAVGLSGDLAAHLGVPLSPAVFYEHPTIERLARHLSAQTEQTSRTRSESAMTVATAEPLAIVGMACRLPGGVVDPAGLLRLLLDERDAITTVTRWQHREGAPSGHQLGGWVDGVDAFDAEFFRISPREASAMDPQQRLLLEVAWEAFSDAGLRPWSLGGSRTGVYVGLSLHDHAHAAMTSGAVDAYTATGSAGSVAAGRIAYTFGLRGPAMVVDTACSSSLVAVHLAASGLAAGDCDAALVGGVNLMLGPTSGDALGMLGALSPDGRCSPFDAKANGTVRSEGVGAIVLRRLSDAVRDGDHVYAVIRGTATNHDGATNGLVAPSGEAQEDVVRTALARAGVSASDIDYVECHGTGTPLGDPIEVRALAAVHAGRPQERPLLIGTAKSNLGHTEAAAGIVGLIKTTLAIAGGELPSSLHFETPTPHVDWASIPVEVVRKVRPWPTRPGAPRRAGVNSFGLSGTNAHVVLEEAPSAARSDEPPTTLLPLCVSAKTPDALRAYADRMADALASRELAAHDVAFTAATRQSHLEHRLVAVGSSTEEWSEQLRAHARGEWHRGLALGRSFGAPPVLAFVFSGHGSHWVGMGRALYEWSPVFREHIDRCEAAFRPFVKWSLREQLFADESAAHGDLDVVQPLVFAIQTALATTLAHWGVVPDIVLGHSMGEVSAAFAAGALSLGDAARVICIRSRLLHRLRDRGAMAIVELGAADAEAELAGHTGRVHIAALNSVRSTIIAGDTDALASLVERLRQRGIDCSPIRGANVAGHCPHVDPLRDDLLRELSMLTPKEPRIRFASTAVLDADVKPSFDAEYWWTNLRQPVHFFPRVQEVVRGGRTVFVELSPQPLMSAALEECVRGSDGVVVATSRRNEPEQQTLLKALGTVHAAGHRVDFQRVFPRGGRAVHLPAYPWNHAERWRPRATNARPRGRWALLASHVALSDQPGKHVFEVELDLANDAHAYFADHKVHGVVWVPAAAHLEMTLEASRVAFAGQDVAVEGLELLRALTLTEGVPSLVQLVITPSESGDSSFTIASRPAGDSTTAWTTHSRGRLRAFAAGREERGTPGDSIEAITARCSRVVTGTSIYDGLEDLDVDYGPRFQGMLQIFGGEGEALSKLAPLDVLTEHRSGYVVHPSLLDSSFQTLLVAMKASLNTGRIYLPASVKSMRVLRGDAPRWAHVVMRSSTADAVEADVQLLGEDGQLVADVRGLRAVNPKGPTERDTLADWVLEIAWRSRPFSAVTSIDGGWLVLSDAEGIGPSLRRWLEARGAAVVVYDAADVRDPTALVARLKQDFRRRPPKRIVDLRCTETRAPGAMLDEDVARRATELAAVGVLHLARAIVAMGWAEAPRLFLVTRGCQAVIDSADVHFPEQALAWGFGASVAQEMPSLRTTLVDLEGDRPNDALGEALGSALATADDEDRIALRGGERKVPRLVRRARATSATMSSSKDTAELAPDGTYLVTGGLGALGLVVAERLADRGAKHLALLSRSAPEKRARLDALEAHGVHVYLLHADVSDPQALRDALAALARVAPPVVGLIHAAGVLDDATLTTLTPRQIETVIRPKVLGALALEEALPTVSMRVYFSSIAGVLGSPGQAHYAAGNTFLDAFAHYLAAQSKRALSLDWGAWSELGAEQSEARAANVTRQGLTLIEPGDGGEVFDRLLSATESQLAVLPVNARRWSKANPMVGTMPLLRELLASGKRAGDHHDGDLLERVRAATTEAARLTVLRDALTKTIASIARASTNVVARAQSLKDLGFDSLMLVTLKNHLERAIAVPLSVAGLVANPTIDGLAAHLSSKLRPHLPPLGGAGEASARADTEVTTLGGLRVWRLTPGSDPGSTASLPLTVVLLQGYGVAGDHLVPLATMLEPPPRTALYFPEGRCSMAELEGDPALGHQRGWWRIDADVQEKLRAGTLTVDGIAGLVEARESVLALLEELVAKEPSARLVLGGFSQGGVLAIDVALHLPSRIRLAGLIAMSSPMAPEWAASLAARRELPMFMSHGTRDALFPFSGAEREHARLTEAGIRVTFHRFEGDHELPPSVVSSLSKWLKEL